MATAMVLSAEPPTVARSSHCLDAVVRHQRRYGAWLLVLEACRDGAVVPQLLDHGPHLPHLGQLLLKLGNKGAFRGRWDGAGWWEGEGGTTGETPTGYQAGPLRCPTSHDAAGSRYGEAAFAQPSEPILFPKLRIHFADFPYLHCSID